MTKTVEGSIISWDVPPKISRVFAMDSRTWSNFRELRILILLRATEIQYNSLNSTNHWPDHKNGSSTNNMPILVAHLTPACKCCRSCRRRLQLKPRGKILWPRPSSGASSQISFLGSLQLRWQSLRRLLKERRLKRSTGSANGNFTATTTHRVLPRTFKVMKMKWCSISRLTQSKLFSWTKEILISTGKGSPTPGPFVHFLSPRSPLGLLRRSCLLLSTFSRHRATILMPPSRTATTDPS